MQDRLPVRRHMHLVLSDVPRRTAVDDNHDELVVCKRPNIFTGSGALDAACPTTCWPMKEYRVLTQRDSFWAGATDSAGLEAGLNRLARTGWEVKAIVPGESWSTWVGLRGQLVVILERESTGASTAADAPPSIVDADDGYDATRIPAQRYYQNVGNVSSLMQQAGLVDRAGLDRAREHFARRGGHLLDHVLALGLVDDESLRGFLRKNFNVG